MLLETNKRKDTLRTLSLLERLPANENLLSKRQEHTESWWWLGKCPSNITCHQKTKASFQ